MKKLFTLLLFTVQFSAVVAQKIDFPQDVPGLTAAVERLKSAFASQRILQYQVRIQRGSDPAIKAEGFSIRNAPELIVITANDPSGLRYGVLTLAEQVRSYKSLAKVPSQTVNPSLEVRAIKFNLPWDAYRESKSMEYHLSTCRDLKFWQQFLDMMQDNRFNQLALYNMHPFHYMVKLADYPEASPFSDEEMAQWQAFWKGLFKLAEERGVEVFVVNWNIVVPQAFAAHHGVKRLNDTSKVVRDYTRAAVTEVINTYDGLAGLGVTLADWMTQMTPAEREDWIADTFIAGMRQAKRPVKFLHRAVLSGSSDEMRRILNAADLQAPVQVEVKFNWSHGHSTPRLLITHASESGLVNTGFWEPKPANYKIQWMVRNEDFFILRWGEPDFIRQHIQANTKDFMNGYYIGSEGYIPAFEYFTKPEVGPTWQYAFERQWLFYALWGRMLYDNSTPDTFFEAMFNEKYRFDKGRDMLEAYRLVSRMPLRLSSYFAATWDYTLYAEGFMAPVIPRGYGYDDKQSFFISLQELMDHKVLDPTYLSVGEYASLTLKGSGYPHDKVTPPQLTGQLLSYADRADELVRGLSYYKSVFSAEFNQELDDITSWSLLSRYFALKLEAAVALALFQQTGGRDQKVKAVTLLEEALEVWKELVQVTGRNYREVPYIVGSVFGFQDEKQDYFSWANLTGEVERDIAVARAATFSTRK